MLHNEPFSNTITVYASATTLWAALTTPDSMKHWMTDTEIEIDVTTTWQIDTPIMISGHIHTIPFTNNGSVIQFIPERILQYTHRSSLSNLPDMPASYSTLLFNITPHNDHATLTLTIANFPTESIYKHLVLYWSTTLLILKAFTERTPGVEL